MSSTSLWTLMALVLALPNAASGQGDTNPVVNCQLMSIEDLSVPGSDNGVLVSMKVKEGMLVTKDMELGRIDDREAQAQMAVKKLEFEVAKEEARSDVQVRYAAKDAEVNKAIYDKLRQANDKSKGSVTDVELRKAKFEWEKAELSIEKAKEKLVTDDLTAKAKKAEVQAAEVVVDRRILRAPFDGVVVKVYKNVGEWISPGDEVLRIVRIDRLRVPVNLDASKWTPDEIENRKVTVEVKLSRDRPPVKVQGQIVFVSPVVYQGQLMEVAAEIETPMDADGLPLVRAGLEAQMTIHVDQPANSVERAAPAAARKPAPGKSTASKAAGR